MIRSAQRREDFSIQTSLKSREIRMETLEEIKHKQEALLQKTASPPCTTANFEKSFRRQFLDFLSDSYTILFVFLSSFIHKITRIFRFVLVFLIFKISRLLQNCCQIYCPGLIVYFQYNFVLFSLIYFYIHNPWFVQLFLELRNRIFGGESKELR